MAIVKIPFNDEEIVGTLEGPDSAPLVIMVHGLGSHKDQGFYPQLAQKVPCASYRFTFPGSDREISLVRGFSENVEIIRTVIEYFRSRGRVVFCLLGHSKGADEVFLYGLKYGDVSNLIGIAGRFDMRQGFERYLGDEDPQDIINKGSVVTSTSSGTRLRITRAFYQERQALSMKDVSSLSCDVLLVHGTGDHIVPIDDAYSFHEAITKSTLVTVDLADHNFKGRYGEIIDPLVDWLKKRL